MKSKTTQFPPPFQYKKSDPDIFSQESTIISSKKQSEMSLWKENKSFEIRKAANSKSHLVQLAPANESQTDRLISNKIKDINRLISMVKSKYSKEYFEARVYSSSNLQSTLVLDDLNTSLKFQKKQKVKKVQVNDVDIVLHSYKPIVYSQVNENPLRRRFNNQYERAYRQVVSSFFRL